MSDTDNVRELHPGEDRRISTLSDDLRKVVLEHIGRGYLTEAALLGVIVSLLLDTRDLLEEDDG